MIDVHIKTVEHTEQRYNTVGDYLTDDNGKTKIIISELGDHRLEFLIALHELVEVFLCRQAGITDEQIDEFDFSFAERRCDDATDEPGDHPDAPYHEQHSFATLIERMACRELGINWDEYDSLVGNLMIERQRA